LKIQRSSDVVRGAKGWSVGDSEVIPDFLNIQDLVRRVMKFVLDFDPGNIRRERRAPRDIAVIEQQWIRRRAELD
jgi:hypothetical protein